MKILLCYVLTFSYIFIILGISGVLKKKNILSNEGTRKLVHILVSGAFIIMYKTIYINMNIIIIPLLFAIINYISNKHNVFKGMEIETRESYGTVYYPISMAIMATITYFNHSFYPYYGIGLFIMAFADGLAPIIGKRITSKKILNTDKTLAGSITVFMVSIVVTIIFNSILKLDMTVFKIIIIGLYSSLVEIVSYKYDNILLPLATSILAYFL